MDPNLRQARTWPNIMAIAAAERIRIIRFLLVGLLNTAVGYAIFAACLGIGLNSLWAVVIATVLGALFNFRSIGHLVFGSNDLRLIGRFLCVYGLQAGINMAALTLARRIHVPELYAEAFALPCLAVFSYAAMRIFVFAPGMREDREK